MCEPNHCTLVRLKSAQLLQYLQSPQWRYYQIMPGKPYGREALREYREAQAAAEKEKSAATAPRRPRWSVTVYFDEREKASILKAARSLNLTPSNYLRGLHGLPPISPGRPEKRPNN